VIVSQFDVKNALKETQKRAIRKFGREKKDRPQLPLFDM
jgi:hypothetical protein